MPRQELSKWGERLATALKAAGYTQNKLVGLGFGSSTARRLLRMDKADPSLASAERAAHLVGLDLRPK